MKGQTLENQEKTVQPLGEDHGEGKIWSGCQLGRTEPLHCVYKMMSCEYNEVVLEIHGSYMNHSHIDQQKCQTSYPEEDQSYTLFTLILPMYLRYCEQLELLVLNFVYMYVSYFPSHCVHSFDKQES
jgi:hypothetical protein